MTLKICWLVALLFVPSITLAASNDEIYAAMSKSDDYSEHKDEFNAAGVKLVREGACSVADLIEYGGFWKSTKRKDGYFIDCKGKRVDYVLGEISSAATITPLQESTATKYCRQSIEEQALHGKPDYHVLDYATNVFGNGNVGVTQGFTAKNGFGIELDYRAYCLVMPDGTVEIQSLEEK